MGKRYLIYNFSGELDDISHLFPNERLARIAAILRSHGQFAEVIDRANFADMQAFGAEYLENLGRLSYDETNALYTSKLAEEAKALLQGQYDTILLNLWQGTGFKFSMDLARLLKSQRPDLRIYGIGQKIDWFKEHILSLAEGALDGLITGLGYNAIEMLATQGHIDDCPNTILPNDGRPVVNEKAVISLDAYPDGEYSEAVYHGIAGKIPLHTLSLSNQACPNHCVFCVRPENYGHVNVPRDISRVLAEMRESFHRYHIRHFRFEDSTPPPHALTEISRAILGSEMAGQVRFSAFSRIDTNAMEDFGLLHEAGCLALFFGIESFDDGNLHRLRKGITYPAIQATLRRAHDAGIHTLSNFIVPIPGETQDSIDVTLRRIGECREVLDSVLTLPAGVYPPTTWGQNPSAYGILLDEEYIRKFVTYPVKYLFPLHLWPRLPFRYGVMGRPAEQVDPVEIFAIHNEFQQRVRDEYGLPPVPDYAFLLADYLQEEYPHCTQQLVSRMIARDYAGLEALIQRKSCTTA